MGRLGANFFDPFRMVSPLVKRANTIESTPRVLSITDVVSLASSIISLLYVWEDGELGGNDWVPILGFSLFCVAWVLQSVVLLVNIKKTADVEDLLNIVKGNGWEIKPYYGGDSEFAKITPKAAKVFKKFKDKDVQVVFVGLLHISTLVAAILCFTGTLAIQRVSDAIILAVLPLINEASMFSDTWHREGEIVALANLMGSEELRTNPITERFLSRKIFGKTVAEVAAEIGLVVKAGHTVLSHNSGQDAVITGGGLPDALLTGVGLSAAKASAEIVDSGDLESDSRYTYETSEPNSFTSEFSYTPAYSSFS